MRLLVVDDERLARLRMQHMLAELLPEAEVVFARDGDEALAQLASAEVDVVLLDIEMPGLDGLALARQQALPPVVFVTAHRDFAPEAFEVEAVDYLLKPVSAARLERALARAGVARPQPRILTRQRAELSLFDPSQIERFYARDKYVAFVHDGREHLLEQSLSELEAQLAPQGFVRCHRAELVRVGAIVRLARQGRGGVAVLASGATARVSRRDYGELRRRLLDDVE